MESQFEGFLPTSNSQFRTVDRPKSALFCHVHFKRPLFASIGDGRGSELPVGIQSFMLRYSTDWGSLMASAALAMVPTLILFLFIQKYMISGATAGAVKG